MRELRRQTFTLHSYPRLKLLSSRPILFKGTRGIVRLVCFGLRSFNSYYHDIPIWLAWKTEQTEQELILVERIKWLCLQAVIHEISFFDISLSLVSYNFLSFPIKSFSKSPSPGYNTSHPLTSHPCLLFLYYPLPPHHHSALERSFPILAVATPSMPPPPSYGFTVPCWIYDEK